MESTSARAPGRRAPGGTAFEAAIASRALAYCRAWLRKHGLKGKVLASTTAALEPKLLEIVSSQCADLVVMTLADDGLSILASDRDSDLEAFVAATYPDCRGQFGLNLPALAGEVRRDAEGRACRESCRH